jgi:DNA-binding HxlR family transcriptional regulator
MAASAKFNKKTRKREEKGMSAMRAKENAGLGQLLELLEARYALRLLWALKNGRPQTFRLLQDSIGQITPNTLNTRLKELRAAGLVHHDGNGYLLTVLGSDLLKRLNELPTFANKWSSEESKKNLQ